MTPHETGALGEAAVAYYLEALGYEILARGYRIRGGEIDLVAARGEELCFVEVKTRRLGASESGMEAVDRQKMARLIRTAYAYCEREGIDESKWYLRYDIAEVTTYKGRIIDIDHLESAFDESDFHDNIQKY